jgi:glutamate/aspartate transport system substrate-binding protein
MRANKFFTAISLLIVLASTGYAGTAAVAAEKAELSGTLKKIKSSGKIVLGVRDSSIPFSFIDNQQNYQGYSIDICLRVVDTIKKHLGMPDLKVMMNPVTSATRIPLTTNGTIDLECGSTSNNLERQKQVAFAPTTFISGARLLSKKSSNITGLEDLRGKTVVTNSGSNITRQLARLNAEKNLGLKIMTSKDMSEGFLMVETGRAVSFAMDDILLAGLAANSKTPNEYSITQQAITVEPYAIMMRQNDHAFKNMVDGAIKNLFKSGEINTIYNKWFTSPIPPKGINLNWPMPDILRNTISNPTDSGDPASYSALKTSPPADSVPRRNLT